MTRGETIGGALTIGILGQFGSGNSGNDGSLRAMAGWLERAVPDARLVCICTVPDKVNAELGITAIHTHGWASETASGLAANRILGAASRRIGAWPYAYRVVRTLDALIVPGTGIFDDFQDGPFGWPYVMFRWCSLARLTGVPTAFVSIGAGPIHHRIGRLLAKRALATARYRSYRDRSSLRFADDLGVDTGSDDVFPDIAFGLPAPRSGRSATAPGAGLAVALGVMTYTGWHKGASDGERIYHAYLDRIAGFADWLVGNGHTVRLVTGDRMDERAVDDLMGRPAIARAAESGRLVASPTASLDALMEQIAGTDIVVATRFHNIVCALKLRRPTISIAYAAKNDDLMADVGLQDFCQRIETLDVERLKEQFGRAVAGLDGLRDGLDRAVTVIEDRLSGQNDHVLEVLFDERVRLEHTSGGFDEGTGYRAPWLHRQHHAAHAPRRRA